MNAKTVIVTGASQGIGAGVVQTFLARGYDVTGTANTTKSKELSASDHLALVVRLFSGTRLWPAWYFT